MTSARIKGELSDTAWAYSKELDAMLEKSPGVDAPRGDNTVGSVSRTPQRLIRKQKGRE